MDDDDDDQEDDVFYDPGFTPELEEISDDDNRNEDIEIVTPGTLVGVWNPVNNGSNQAVLMFYRPPLPYPPLTF